MLHWRCNGARAQEDAQAIFGSLQVADLAFPQPLGVPAELQRFLAFHRTFDLRAPQTRQPSIIKSEPKPDWLIARATNVKPLTPANAGSTHA